MAAAAVKAVDVLGIAKVSPPDCFGQGLLFVRNGHQMDVVAHEAVRQDLQAVLACLLLEQFQVHPPILVHEEHVLAVVPALRDMMGAPNSYGSG